jgi:hypothetical protein
VETGNAAFQVQQSHYSIDALAATVLNA